VSRTVTSHAARRWRQGSTGLLLALLAFRAPAAAAAGAGAATGERPPSRLRLVRPAAPLVPGQQATLAIETLGERGQPLAAQHPIAVSLFGAAGLTATKLVTLPAGSSQVTVQLSSVKPGLWQIEARAHGLYSASTVVVCVAPAVLERHQALALAPAGRTAATGAAAAKAPAEPAVHAPGAAGARAIREPVAATAAANAPAAPAATPIREPATAAIRQPATAATRAPAAAAPARRVMMAPVSRLAPVPPAASAPAPAGASAATLSPPRPPPPLAAMAPPAAAAPAPAAAAAAPGARHEEERLRAVGIAPATTAMPAPMAATNAARPEATAPPAATRAAAAAAVTAGAAAPGAPAGAGAGAPGNAAGEVRLIPEHLQRYRGTKGWDSVSIDAYWYEKGNPSAAPRELEIALVADQGDLHIAPVRLSILPGDFMSKQPAVVTAEAAAKASLQALYPGGQSNLVDVSFLAAPATQLSFSSGPQVIRGFGVVSSDVYVRLLDAAGVPAVADRPIQVNLQLNGPIGSPQLSPAVISAGEIEARVPLELPRMGAYSLIASAASLGDSPPLAIEVAFDWLLLLTTLLGGVLGSMTRVLYRGQGAEAAPRRLLRVLLLGSLAALLVVLLSAFGLLSLLAGALPQGFAAALAKVPLGSLTGVFLLGFLAGLLFDRVFGSLVSPAPAGAGTTKPPAGAGS
jgi:hypothetical protein